MSVRDTAREGKRVAERKVVHVITDGDRDAAVKHDDLLVLTLVHVQRKSAATRLLGLPDAETTTAVACPHVHHDQCVREPQASRVSRTRWHGPRE